MGNACMDWTVTYDEVLIVLSGQLTVRTTDKVMIAGPHDSIWLPAGTSVTYEAEDCVAAYAIHPASGNPTPEAGRRNNAMTRISVLPGDDTTNGWSRILPARTPHAR